ncbi:alpha/beta hydrolase [Fulvimarina sp. 2208YS6-2-32]|uniref:Alpha/beta hydrolase n=1 Tax=Fulvimarina uroteuthidis TaxID=3098149 RepID=A0ABU5HYM0_9HYPH|nr:alpha/beta hydrolase [Fulvimarina sp. 2208YS6-2-32]MDY8107694.1 alpha/beta hydrolase [Fulvimarina sp. 2208YS6-2-32]
MSQFPALTLDSASGAALHVYRAVPAVPKAVILLFHGLAEHAGRYGRVAGILADAGYAVYAHDHRGHGSTVARDAPLRRFARRDGADAVLLDCRTVFDFARSNHPALPLFVFGHSMGGLVAINFAERHARENTIAGLAIWNSSVKADWQLRLGAFGLRIEKALKGSDVASGLFQRAMFDAWAKSIPARRTEFDWLSHDPGAVDAYIADPLCGFTPTVSMMDDIITLIRKGGAPASIAALPDDIPVHLLGGSEDPVTGKGEALHWLAGRLRDKGLGDVTLSIVEGARHETLNEMASLRDPAIADLIAWMDARIAQRTGRKR